MSALRDAREGRRVAGDHQRARRTSPRHLGGNPRALAECLPDRALSARAWLARMARRADAAERALPLCPTCCHAPGLAPEPDCPTCGGRGYNVELAPACETCEGTGWFEFEPATVTRCPNGCAPSNLTPGDRRAARLR